MEWQKVLSYQKQEREYNIYERHYTQVLLLNAKSGEYKKRPFTGSPSFVIKVFEKFRSMQFIQNGTEIIFQHSCQAS